MCGSLMSVMAVPVPPLSLVVDCGRLVVLSWVILPAADWCCCVLEVRVMVGSVGVLLMLSLNGG